MADTEKQVKGGSIQTINKDAKTLQVKSDSGEIVLGVDNDTTITVNSYYRKIDDLSSGQKVKKIYYAEKNGKKLATIIHVIDEKLLEIQKLKKGPAQKEERKPAI
ncbi:MAG: hypothetical protein AABY42_04855 [Nitrospirota bacterium]